MPNPSIRKITVNSTTYDIIPKYEGEGDSETVFLRGDGQWTTTPGQEVFIASTEPQEAGARIWLKV